MQRISSAANFSSSAIIFCNVMWHRGALTLASSILSPVPAKPDRQFKIGDKVRVNLHHGKIEDAIVRAVIQDGNEIKLQVDVVGLNLTALIDTRQVVE